MDQKAQLDTQPTASGTGFLFEMPVRWGDLDAHQHVNNTVYFRYMEEARVSCMRACGIGGPGSERAIVLANVSCDFLRPILWPATVVVETRLLSLGRSSVEFEVDLHIKGDPAGACARSRNIVVGVAAETGRAMPWTPAEREGIARVFNSSDT